MIQARGEAHTCAWLSLWPWKVLRCEGGRVLRCGRGKVLRCEGGRVLRCGRGKVLRWEGIKVGRGKVLLALFKVIPCKLFISSNYMNCIIV